MVTVKLEDDDVRVAFLCNEIARLRRLYFDVHNEVRQVAHEVRLLQERQAPDTHNETTCATEEVDIAEALERR